MTTMYTPDHEWINIEDHEAAIVGITCMRRTRWATWSSSTCPKWAARYKKGEVAGVVESVKAAADLYMPVSGEVVEVNEALRADPSLANTDPLGNGWFFKVHVDRHGRVRPADGRPGLRRAGQERLNLAA